MSFNRKQKIFVILSGVVVLVSRRYLGLQSRMIIALWIIILSLCFFKAESKIGTVLSWFGKHSGNVFMFHTFLYNYYFKEFIYGFRYPILILVILLAICMTISVAIEWIKKRICYDILEQKVVALIRMKANKEAVVTN